MILKVFTILTIIAIITILKYNLTCKIFNHNVFRIGLIID